MFGITDRQAREDLSNCFVEFAYQGRGSKIEV